MKPAICFASISILLLAGDVGACKNACVAKVLVTVLDQSTHQSIDGLTAAEFHAKFRGQDLVVRSVSRPPAERRLIFVLDRSGSMRASNQLGQGHAALVPAILERALSVIPSTDRVAYLVFSGDYSKRTPFLEPSAARQLMPEMLAWEPGGHGGKKHRTPLWDNIDSALKILNPPALGDLIVVISDGDDNLSKLGEGELRKELLDAEVPVMGFAVSGPAPGVSSGPRDLIDLAKDSGGTGSVYGTPRFVDTAFQSPTPPDQLIALLTHQYELEIVTTSFQTVEHLRLEVAPLEPGKKAYIYNPQTSPAACPAAP